MKGTTHVCPECGTRHDLGVVAGFAPASALCWLCSALHEQRARAEKKQLEIPLREQETGNRERAA